MVKYVPVLFFIIDCLPLNETMMLAIGNFLLLNWLSRNGVIGCREQSILISQLY